MRHLTTTQHRFCGLLSASWQASFWERSVADVLEIEKMQRKHVKAAAVYQCPGCGACGKIDPHNYVAVVQHADDCPRMDEYEEQR